TEGTIKYAHKNTLKDQLVVLISENSTRKQTLSRYLSFMGAKTLQADTLDEIEQHQESFGIVWVLDGVDSIEKTNS
ncbi:hypothetical protein ACKI1Z_43770, partial [Streptomyces galilaeus]|uniref:hypothetical protein n=1 Tax=Streptomyces galilaeus TaxID=33899 RepID=UPI0038F75CB9